MNGIIGKLKSLLHPGRGLLYLAIGLATVSCQVDNEAGSRIASLSGLDHTAPSFSGAKTITGITANYFTVEWNPANDNGKTPPSQIEYNLYIAAAPGGQNFAAAPQFTTIGTTFKIVNGLGQTTTYCVVVRAKDSAGNEESNTNENCAATLADGSPPVFAGIAAAALTQSAPAEITLNWAPALDETTPAGELVYLVYRAEFFGGQNFTTPLATVTGSTGYVDSSVLNDRNYYYVVRAQDLSGNIDGNAVQQSASTPFGSTGFSLGYFPGLQHDARTGSAAALIDWNADGLLDIAVGAYRTGNPGAGTAAYRAGQVNIYHGQGGGVFSTDPDVQFYSPNSLAQGYFARAMAVCDIRGDGSVDDLIVGASGERRVYLYLNTLTGQDTIPDRTLNVPTGQGDTDDFGEGIACGVFNGIGGDDLVIAAPGGDTGGANTGRLFFYNNNSTGGVIDITGPNAAYFISPSADFTTGTQPYCGQGLALKDLDGDTIADLVVGCPFSDPGGSTNDGIVAFYKKAAANGTNDWTPAGSTAAPNNDDRWGDALAVGNFDDSLPGEELAVGQPNYDSPGSNAGAVSFHTVTFSNPNFSISGPLATITDRGVNGVAAAFGDALAAGDVGGDGVSDLLVGAPDEDYLFGSVNTGANLGGVYYFGGTAGGLMDGTPEKSDFNSNLDSQGRDIHGGTFDIRFGYSLCTGDIDNDGRDDILIGAENDSTNGAGTGGVYVWYSVPSGEIDLSAPNDALFTAPGSVVNKRFGTSCLVFDFNGDGLNDVLIGSQYADDNAADQGAVYAYLGVPSPNTGGADTGSVPVDNTPDSMLFVPVSSTAASHYFGKSLTSCDLTGDGFDELIVGARGFDGALTNLGNPRGSTNEGAVFVFQGSAAGIDPTRFQGLFPTDQNVGLNLFGQPAYSDNNFGYAVTCFPTVNGGVGMDLVVGAPFSAKSGGNANQGMAAIFLGAVNEDPTAFCASNDFVGNACLIEDTRDIRLDDQGPIVNDDSFFGSSLAVGDWDGLDGADLVIGASRARLPAPNPNNNGGVYAFRGALGGGFLDFVSGLPQSAFSYLDPTNYINNRFGDGGLALSDLNNNAIPELIVGAYLCSYEDPVKGKRGASTGCVFIDRGDYRP